MNLKWNEIDDIVFIDKKIFYQLLKWIKKQKGTDLVILSHTGKKPKI